jgi:hypothetical protein
MAKGNIFLQLMMAWRKRPAKGCLEGVMAVWERGTVFAYEDVWTF